MKILLLVNGSWHSFISQGRALQTALRDAGTEVELLISADTVPDLTPYRDGYLVVPIGSWQHYDSIIAPPLDAGCKTLPWIVSDGSVSPEIAEKLNKLPWFLTTSEYCYRIFTRDHVDRERIKVMYECVDDDIWRPYSTEELEVFFELLSIDEEDRTNLPPSYNLRRAKQEHIPILCTIGGDAGSKGGVEILKSLHNIGDSMPWVYLIKTMPIEPGHTRLKPVEQDIIDASQGVAQNIRYISGEFSQHFMVGLMNFCDIYIATSRGEGFGLPLVEAQMCGKMVVTHRANSTPETIIEGKTGLLAECHIDDKGIARADIDDLSALLKRVLSDHQLRQELSSQARQIAVERFGKKSIAAQFLAHAKDFSA